MFSDFSQFRRAPRQVALAFSSNSFLLGWVSELHQWHCMGPAAAKLSGSWRGAMRVQCSGTRQGFTAPDFLSFCRSFLVGHLIPTSFRREGLLLHLITLNDKHTLGRTTLDEWSARRRDLYLTIHNIRKRQTSMLPARFEPAFLASELPKKYSLDGAANWDRQNLLPRSKHTAIHYQVQLLNMCRYNRSTNIVAITENVWIHHVGKIKIRALNLVVHIVTTEY